MLHRVAIYVRQNGTSSELISNLRSAIKDRGGVVSATFVDDARITGRGKYVGWRNLLANLPAINQVVLSNAGDIPGKTVPDLLKVLNFYRDHGVSLYLHAERIDTGSTSFAWLDLIAAYRRAKLSAAIRNGQAKAVAAGKKIGRPVVPPRVKARIRSALTQGGGIRPTARRFNVSPALVINVRNLMDASQCTSS
jgi:DNA invertase Pin-like site-specific DNA recombinase